MALWCKCNQTISPEEEGNMFTFVGLFVRLSVCEQDLSQSCGPIFVKLSGWMRHVPRISYICGLILIRIRIHDQFFEVSKSTVI